MKEFTMKIQTLMTALVLAASGAAFAQTTAGPAAAAPVPAASAAQTDKIPAATPSSKTPQAMQKKSADKGVEAAPLNKKEATDLEKSEAKLDANKPAGDKADKKLAKPAPKKSKSKAKASLDDKATDTQKTDEPVIDPVK
jgi:hypothetical protein